VFFTACKIEHLKMLTPTDYQKPEYALSMDSASVVGVVENTLAFSGWAGGRCLGAAGVLDIWKGRSVVWALLSPLAGPHMRAITRHVNYILDAHGAERYECTVDPRFAAGIKWVERLGFTCEAPAMRRFDPTGRTMALYAKVKP
jgi:hypothetical protein